MIRKIIRNVVSNNLLHVKRTAIQTFAGMDKGVQENNHALVCYNAESPLRIPAFRMLSTTFETKDTRFFPGVTNPLGTKDDIKVDMIVYYEDLVPHMNVYFAPHSDATTTLPANATKYDVTAETVTGTALYGAWGAKTAVVATMNYKPAEDPNFSIYTEMDMFVTYDDEVIYKVSLAQFYNN